ncbi:hypothetical protein [Citricoccus alkalitolerans]|uniref:Uncharacterized protein n=1 Tax=Citricoccus alkalitolerans TaxID=246603 RepID=A0ABV8XVZ8_9MICC
MGNLTLKTDGLWRQIPQLPLTAAAIGAVLSSDPLDPLDPDGYPVLHVAIHAAGSDVGHGRENHKMMLDHYQQTKNLLVSYTESKQGFF